MNNNKNHITIQLVPPWNYASPRVWFKQFKILRVIKATMVAILVLELLQEQTIDLVLVTKPLQFTGME